MKIQLVNDDPFGNTVRVEDENANKAVIFNDFIAEHQSVTLQCRENSAGYGNIITYQDGSTSGIRRGMLNEGDVVSL